MMGTYFSLNFYFIFVLQHVYIYYNKFSYRSFQNTKKDSEESLLTIVNLFCSILCWQGIKYAAFRSSGSVVVHSLFTGCLYLGLAARKPVFGVSGKARLKPVSSTTETSQKIEISPVASLHIILSKKRITKALIRLRGCAGWSAPVLIANPRR